MKYKAKASFKDLDDKYFGIHKANNLVKGGDIEITDFDSLPKSVQDELEPIQVKEKKQKAKNKKGVK